MKRKYVVLAFLLLTGQFLFAGDLFFSEYIEGGSYNKAIEIRIPITAPKTPKLGERSLKKKVSPGTIIIIIINIKVYFSFAVKITLDFCENY